MAFVIPASARSWIDYPQDTEFPIQNIPFGRISRAGSPRIATRIGDTTVDLVELKHSGLLSEEILPVEDRLEAYDSGSLRRLRQRVYELLHSDNDELRDDDSTRSRCLVPLAHAEVILPIRPNAFIDFYSGVYHASNVGKMFRPDQPPLLPNYRHLPVGYNGRASSVFIGDMPIHRPRGQQKSPNEELPTFGPCRELDFELEMGFFLSQGTEPGQSISTGDASDYISGIVMVNDWSARDVQRWEYQPLGPFLAKSFATSISPWVVTLDALAPFRVNGQVQDPPVLPHLAQPSNAHFDIHLEVWIQTAKASRPQRICVSNMKHLYWSVFQQLAHQSSNGTPLESGDLYASGTISGPEAGTYGSLLELTWKGTQEIAISETGETRKFLEDGDVVIFRGYQQADGYRIGFGELKTKVLPAP